MTAERWNKIKALFSSAQEVSMGERDEFLTRACAGDEELRSEIERLLDSDKGDDAFLRDSAVAEVAGLFDSGDQNDFENTDGSTRLEPGSRVNDRYEIVRLLGRGGMGEVYLATDTRINRNVALKVLASDLVSSKESLRRFALEAQAVSALNHPHIMTIHEFDRTREGALFFVAEYIDGQTLNRLIGPNLDLEHALEIAIQVSSALSAAHEAGITHRDIKPENVMVRRDGYVKVLDFGLAKLAQKPGSPASAGPEDPTEALQRTRPGAVMGTASYMSPEQARGLHVDARTDIWSLGAVIYEMLTGGRPFLGDTSADVIVSVLSNEPPPLSSFGRELPAELEWVVTKALTKNVENRYQTSKGLRSDLERIKKQIEFKGRPDQPLHETAIVSGQGDDAGLTAEQAAHSDGNGKAVTDGQGGALTGRSFMSSPSFAEVVGQARAHKVGFSLLAMILVGAISTILYLTFMTRPVSARIDSIAVLPFENLSGNSDLTYASDGLSEALIDRLSQLPEVKVISRSSSFKFRGPNVDIRQAASQLGARAIVTGTVTQVGDDLAVRFDVIDAVEDRHVTGGNYRRKASDLMQVQSEIARTASERLGLNLTDLQANRLTENGTQNSEAYRYYLSGLVEVNGPTDVRGRALEYFEHAAKLDPNFAAAYAEIAEIYWVRAHSSDDPHVMMPKAAAAIDRALALDPNLPKAHALRATVREYEFEWQQAETAYKRAIDLNPNLDFARNNYAFFLSVMGRHNGALAELEQQRLRDPINRRLGLLQKAIVLIQARKFDEALSAYSEAHAVEPTREVPSFSLGYAYGGKGLYKEAAEHYRKAVDLFGGEDEYSQPLVYLAAAYAKMPEKRTDARAILTRIETRNQYTSPALLAAIYAALDDNDKAIELLEKAYIERDLLLRFIGTGYEYDGLRQDPRFVDLIRRTGVVQ